MKSKTILFQICLIVCLTAASFYPVLSSGFISIDDGRMLLGNEKIFNLTYANTIKYFTEFHWGLYHPLVLVSYALEFKFFKFNPLIYHTTNLYLHLFNCLLVFWLFLLLTQNSWKSLLVALLFGVHPIHVESVAWVTERKDVLYAFFYLGAAVSYIYYLKKDKNCKYLFLTLLLFILSLLSKPMAVTLPLLLILFDYMSIGRVKFENINEKLPFFMIASIFAVMAVLGQKGLHGTTEPTILNAVHNCLEANYCLMLYIYKTLAPFKYSLFYSHYIEGLNLIKGYIWYSPFALSLLVAMVIYSARYTRKGIYGALFMGITLLPASNLFAFGISIPGLRHMYIPILGLFYIFVEAGGWLIQKIKGKRILYYFVVSVIALVVISLSVITNTRCRQWKDTFTLFSGIIMEYPDAVNSKYAYNGLANWYLDKGDTVNAVKCSEKSHQLDNAYPDYYYFKSRLAYLRQDYKNSLDYLNEAISHCKSIDKDVYSIFKSDILCKLKYYDQALLSADGVIKNKYFTSLGYELKGKIYYEMGNYESAISESSKAIEMNSYDADAYTTRCLSYKYLGESQKSANDFKKLSEVEASYAKIE